jgi:pyrrolysine biosynthesis protein PylC
MSFRLGILGGGLQGTEAAALSRWSGWETVLADGRPAPPARDLAGRFVHAEIKDFSDLDRVFGDCDLLLPVCEDLPTLKLLSDWRRHGGPPVAFDLDAYMISYDKATSKDLFLAAGAPTPQSYSGTGEIIYPLIAKPVSSSGSRGVSLLKSKADFKRLFPNGDSRGWVVEEYCVGPSYSLEVTGRPGRYQGWQVTALEMDEVYDCRQVWAPADLSAEEDAELRSISLAIARALKLNGLMDVEVILTPQGFRVLEIDARLPSQTPTVVYWSTGENLIARLANLFGFNPLTAGPRPEGGAPRGVIYEQVLMSPEGCRLSGEHVISAAGPLSLRQDFFGADWALTDYQPGLKRWVAILITIAASQAEARERRLETMNRLKSEGGW